MKECHPRVLEVAQSLCLNCEHFNSPALSSCRSCELCENACNWSPYTPISGQNGLAQIVSMLMEVINNQHEGELNDSVEMKLALRGLRVTAPAVADRIKGILFEEGE